MLTSSNMFSLDYLPCCILDPAHFPDNEAYPGLYSGETGPPFAALSVAESPLGLLFFIMMKGLWRKIAKESNRYNVQHISKRVDRAFENQDGDSTRTKEEIFRKEANKCDIQPYEVLVCVGLLIVRILAQHKRRMNDNWATSARGAVPAGTFGQFMPRHRFEHALSNLHFTNNADKRADNDRPWKVRSVLEVLQRTFMAGFRTPAVLALDEAIIPSRRRYNQTRQYLNGKPRKWGTKLPLMCCAATSHCVRYVPARVCCALWCCMSACPLQGYVRASEHLFFGARQTCWI